MNPRQRHFTDNKVMPKLNLKLNVRASTWRPSVAEPHRAATVSEKCELWKLRKYPASILISFADSRDVLWRKREKILDIKKWRKPRHGCPAN